jgi:hypothetical protein
MGPTDLKFGDLPEVPGVDRAPDQVERMKAFRARHPHVSILPPGQAGVNRPTATWLEADPDPRIDGAAMTVRYDELRDLLNYLEARFDRR